MSELILTGLKFINQLLGKEVVKVGSAQGPGSMNPCTTSFKPVEVPTSMIREQLPLWDSAATTKLVIVDTPGFDDPSVDNSKIPGDIAKWLEKS